MRRLGLVLTALALFATNLTPSADALTALEYPVAVKVLRGTTSASEAQAVSALSSDDDSFFEVTNELRREVYTVVYRFRFALEEKPTQLTLQLNASTSLSHGCELGLDLYRWDTGRWSKAAVGTVGASEAIHTRPMDNARRFVKRGKVLGQVRCTNSVALAVLRSDRIRLIAESP